MTENLLHRFSAFVDLTDRERIAMRDLIGQASFFDATESIQSEGAEAPNLFLLHEGWVLSSITHPDGSRQVLKLHRAGDLMGAPSLPFMAAVESLVALTPARASPIPLGKLGALFNVYPRLGTVLFLAAQEECVTLMDRLAVAGQLGAKHSVLALLLSLFDGRPPSAELGSKLHIPLTQLQIGDVLGLSTVHVNRILVALEKDGLVKRDGRTYELPDVLRLKAIVGMPERVRRRNASWLPAATS